LVKFGINGVAYLLHLEGQNFTVEDMIPKSALNNGK